MPVYHISMPAASYCGSPTYNEEHVEQSIQDGHVQRDEEDDQFLEQKLKRPQQEHAQPLAHGSQVQVHLGHVFLIARLLSHLLRSSLENRGGIGLGKGKGDEDVAEARKNQL